MGNCCGICEVAKADAPAPEKIGENQIITKKLKNSKQTIVMGSGQKTVAVRPDEKDSHEEEAKRSEGNREASSESDSHATQPSASINRNQLLLTQL